MSDLVPEKDYRFPPPPKEARLDRAAWNAVMASLSQRIRSIEAKGTELDDLIADLSFNGQTRIDAAITPLIAQVRVEIENVENLIEKVISDAANAASDVTAEVRSRVAKVELDLDTIETAFARIMAGKLPAANVEESEDRRFVTSAQRQEIADLRSDLASGLAGTRRFSAAYALTFGRL